MTGRASLSAPVRVAARMARVLSPAQWVLRLVVAAAPAVAALCTVGAGESPPGWFVAVLMLMGAGFAVFPESAVGTAAIVLVLAWWGVGLRDGLDWWALPAATALLAAHLGALVASYGPVDLAVDPAVLGLWARRGCGLLGSALLVFAFAHWVRDAPEPPGVWLAGLAAAIVAVLGGTLVFSRTRGQV